MRIYFLINILLVSVRMQAQNDSTTDFKNQGEQEDYWTKKRFNTEYQKEYYKRYSDNIKELDTVTYKFDSRILKVIESSKAIRQLFTLGILYPSLIFSINADSLSDGKQKFKNPFRADTVSITNIEELLFLRFSPIVKRFRCLVWLNGVANPFVYLFEITNENATQQTTIEDFIKGASLTFFKQGWIIM